ncbi:MAG: NAD-dependent epimerase/dehydratase family protein, partial [Deltaproteobacteria bacterium]|nr:NAD-dependent epimerase/dehydratase family protein [Deltaproteobacteria bacterium]
MARILVTGACGFVGPSVVNLGVRLGHEVFATDFSDRYQKFLDPKASLKLDLDIRDPKAITDYVAEVQPDILFHVAAYFRYHGPWQTYYSINVEGTRNVLEGALKIPNLKSVVVWSSGSVLGHTFKGSEHLDETALADPRSFYEKSKLLAEELALTYQDRLPVTVIRPAAIYGSGIEYGGPAGTYGALKVIQMMFKNQLHAVPGRGKNRFSFIHVEDLARVAYFLAGQPEAAGQIYNAADRSNHTLAELMIHIARWMRARNIPLNFTPRLHFYLPIIYLLGLWCETLAKFQKREPAVERP